VRRGSVAHRIPENKVRSGKFLKPKAGLAAGVPELILGGEHHHDFHVPSSLLFVLHVRLHWTVCSNQNRSIGGGQLDEGIVDTLVSAEKGRKVFRSAKFQKFKDTQDGAISPNLEDLMVELRFDFDRRVRACRFMPYLAPHG
jgi:hypothetical protein